MAHGGDGATLGRLCLADDREALSEGCRVPRLLGAIGDPRTREQSECFSGESGVNAETRQAFGDPTE